MRVIKKDMQNMKKRLQLAECDIDLALEYKETQPEFAKLHYNLSIECINQFKQQHDIIVQIISNYKKNGREVPEAMQAVYDYMHEEYIDWITEIKIKQELFK